MAMTRRIFVVVCVLFFWRGEPAWARQSPAAPSSATVIADGAVLEQIRAALASEPAVDLSSDRLRFYTHVDAVPRLTFGNGIDSSDDWFRITGFGSRGALGGGGGIDVLALLQQLQARRRRAEAERIRARIDRE